jgi:hypothetical protein
MNSEGKDTDDVPIGPSRRSSIIINVENENPWHMIAEVNKKKAEELVEQDRVFLESIVVPQFMYDFFEEMDDLVVLPLYNDHSVERNKWTEVFQERCKSKLGSIVSCLNNFVGRMNQGTPGISPARGNGKYLAHSEGQLHLMSLACNLNCSIMGIVGPYIFEEDGDELNYEVCLYQVRDVYYRASRYIKTEMITYDIGDLYGVVLPQTLP